ncbi:MAG: ATP-binding cassette domain-containing protein [Deltaproteobacteria bacterium]|jgi:ABC-2 type transport system ATP-binding protein|nr:ATP-binding cassette domain-containing protein [Deltaproteobacteria bacterium]
MIKTESLKKSFGRTRALDSLDLEVPEGELFAFLGPNGAGKTTAIRILTGLSFKDSGKAFVAGVDIDKDPLKAKRLCGLATQNVNLDSELSVRENMDIHGRLFSMSAKERRERTRELLELVELWDRADSLVKSLSGGLKRRLMIARALSHGPRLLFLDEPTVGLDPAIRRRVWSLIKTVNQKGVTVLLTTHYIEEAEFLAGRVAFIHEGRIVREGTPGEIALEVGKWAADTFQDGVLKSSFFADKREATEFLAAAPGGGTLRKVNLEDAFIHLTGKRVL